MGTRQGCVAANRPGDAQTPRALTREGKSPVHLNNTSPEGSCALPLRKADGRVIAWTLLDEADAEIARAHRWYLMSRGYVCRSVRKPRRQVIYLHRLVVGLEEGDRRQVDHINGDRLDNRRMNLRIATARLNMQNQPSRGGTSKYRNVHQRDYGAWTAQVNAGHVCHCLGTFETEKEAAAVASAWRVANLPFSNEDRSVA